MEQQQDKVKIKIIASFIFYKNSVTVMYVSRIGDRSSIIDCAGREWLESGARSRENRQQI